jgi:hypothetical protein
MSYTPKDNTGTLFKNDKKESDSHPNARGSALIDGVEYWVDAWTNEDKNGNKYQKMTFKRKDAKGPGRDKAEAWKAGQPRRHDEDDSAPF